VQALGADRQRSAGGLDRLIAIHELEGHASEELLRRIALTVSVEAPVNERKAALMGGAVSGALTGLGVDIAHAGLTLGAGMITGAVVGALGGAGIARGVNIARGRRGTTCAGTTASCANWWSARCCATWPSRITGAGAASGRKPSIRRSGRRWSARPSPRPRRTLIATWSGREGGRAGGVTKQAAWRRRSVASRRFPPGQ
jgi:hypothetical protein